MPSFGIVGYGKVGKATHKSLLKNSSAVIHDINKSTWLSSVVYCDFTFICLPTNNDDDIKTLTDTVKTIVDQNPSNQIIIRSTVPIGTCAKIERSIGAAIIYMPEFLRERHWQTDCHRRPIVVGRDNADMPEWLGSEHIIECSLAEAELVKMFNNSIATVRVCFANHFYELAAKTGADYNTVLQMHLATRHNQTYLQVPGPDGNRGFSGKCLPKDLNFIIDVMNQLGLDEALFTAVRADNQRWIP